MGRITGLRCLSAAGLLLLASAAAHAVPPNDDCSQAIAVTLPAFSDMQDTDTATVAAGDRSSCGCSVNSNSVWYSVAPTGPVTVVARTLGSGYNTVLDVFEGTCADAQSVVCNDNFGGGQTSQVTFSGCPGRTYLIAVTDICFEGGGTLALDVSSTPGAGDGDGDGTDDCADNCPSRSNPGQEDGNGNGIGDACEDRDGDGWVDAFDNCIDVQNSDQENTDHDATGDACDPCTDPDQDGFGSPGFPATTCALDNCPTVPNADQTDTDGDGHGDACFACTALGPAARFRTLAVTKLATKEIVDNFGFETNGTLLQGPACTPKAVLRNTEFRHISSRAPGVLVATVQRGTAVRWSKHSGDYFEFPSNIVRDALITGGGDVKGPMDPVSPGLIDTTGSRPEVAECEAAIAAVATGSATLAALSPGLVLGKVFVAKGEQAELDLRGKSVVQIEDLAVEGGSGNKLGCTDYGGSLVIRVGAGEQIAVNISKRLNIGVCSQLRVESDVGAIRGFVLLNVVGLGARVRIAGGAAATPGVNILAPLRKVEVGQIIDGAYFARILGKRVLFRGGAVQDDDPAEVCF